MDAVKSFALRTLKQARSWPKRTALRFVTSFKTYSYARDQRASVRRFPEPYRPGLVFDAAVIGMLLITGVAYFTP